MVMSGFGGFGDVGRIGRVANTARMLPAAGALGGLPRQCTYKLSTGKRCPKMASKVFKKRYYCLTHYNKLKNG